MNMSLNIKKGEMKLSKLCTTHIFDKLHCDPLKRETYITTEINKLRMLVLSGEEICSNSHYFNKETSIITQQDSHLTAKTNIKCPNRADVSINDTTQLTISTWFHTCSSIDHHFKKHSLSSIQLEQVNYLYILSASNVFAQTKICTHCLHTIKYVFSISRYYIQVQDRFIVAEFKPLSQTYLLSKVEIFVITYVSHVSHDTISTSNTIYLSRNTLHSTKIIIGFPKTLNHQN